jgi:regulatory protein
LFKDLSKILAMIYSKTYSYEEILQKLRRFCAYQERSHQEAKEKLYHFKLSKTEVEKALSSLIEENFLNEERFASMYAGGKFRMKKWGKVKIAYELKQKRVSEYNIRKALAEIDVADYQQTIEQLAKKKWESLKREQYLVRSFKTKTYLQQKGYEIFLINSVLKAFTTKH